MPHARSWDDDRDHSGPAPVGDGHAPAIAHQDVVLALLAELVGDQLLAATQVPHSMLGYDVLAARP